MKNTVFWTGTLLMSSAFWPSAVLAQHDNCDNDRTAKHIAQVGKFDSWMVRLIEESAIIGGNTAVLYEPAMHSDTLRGRVAYTNPPDCHWRTSNAYADVLGVVKASTSVFPEKRAPATQSTAEGGRCLSGKQDGQMKGRNLIPL